MLCMLHDELKKTHRHIAAMAQAARLEMAGEKTKGEKYSYTLPSIPIIAFLVFYAFTLCACTFGWSIVYYEICSIFFCCCFGCRQSKCL